MKKPASSWRMWIPLLLGLLTLALAVHCSIANDTAGIDRYLSGKYNSSFSFISLYSQEWLPDTHCYAYEDIAGNRFLVQVTTDTLTDNYQSILFDGAAGDYLTGEFPFYCKAFVSTASHYSAESNRHTKLDSYLQSCSVTELFVCTTDLTLDEAYVEEILSSIAKENAIDLSVAFYIVTSHEYEKINGYGHTVAPGNIVLHAQLTIGSDGVIRSRRWECQD